MLIIKVTHKFLLFLSVIIIIVTISNINFITSACKDNDSISKGIDDVDLPYFNNDDDHIVYYGDGIETLDSHQKRQHDTIDIGVYLKRKNIKNDEDHQIIHNNDNLQSFYNLRPLLSADINYDNLESDDDHYNNHNNYYYNKDDDDDDDDDDLKSDDDYYNLFINTPTLINIKNGNLRASNVHQ